MASWGFERREGDLYVVVDKEELGLVKSIKAASKVAFVQVTLVTLQVLKLCLDNFKNESSGVTEGTKSRTLFVKQWRKFLKVSPDSIDSSDISDTNCESVTSDTDINRNGIQDQMQKEYFIGTYNVHLENLIAPEVSRCTRVLDHEHVCKLVESFKKNPSEQLVILVGMTKYETDMSKLSQPTGQQVEVLGGNHTRVALQTLWQKGCLANPCVQVHIYRPMPQTNALAVGFSHNFLLQEKRKAVTFLDKVHLMRACKHSSLESKEEIKEWKDMLTMIFRVKDRRTLHRMFHHHLLMAKLSDEIWLKAVQAGEVNDKFYRQLMKLNDEHAISDCLDILLKDGPKAFKLKVKTLIDSGCVRSHKKKTVAGTGDTLCDLQEEDDDVPHEDVVTDKHIENDEENETGKIEELQRELKLMKEKYDILKVKYNSIEKENQELRNDVENLRNEQKEGNRGRKRAIEINDDKYSTKEKVEAFWRFDDGNESWLAATILTAYADGKMYKVKYDTDQAISKIPKSWIRKCY